jgi:transcriptional regulator with XRE-family HTH domain
MNINNLFAKKKVSLRLDRCINYLFKPMVAKTANKRQETLGELITNRLLELGWSNAELARRTGFSTTYIGNLARDIAPGTKTGKPKRIPDETVERIARALNIPIDRARTAAGLSKSERPSPETIEEALDNALFFDQKGLSEADREKIRPLLQVVDREIDRLKESK